MTLKEKINYELDYKSHSWVEKKIGMKRIETIKRIIIDKSRQE